jgi:hypothetical protein
LYVKRRFNMPAQAKKKTATKTTAKKAAAKKAAPKKAAKPKTPAKKKGPALECGVCGYRVIVDQACGCVEEHALLCCGKPMGKKAK